MAFSVFISLFIPKASGDEGNYLFSYGINGAFDFDFYF